jgi:hypothetical protein
MRGIPQCAAMNGLALKLTSDAKGADGGGYLRSNSAPKKNRKRKRAVAASTALRDKQKFRLPRRMAKCPPNATGVRVCGRNRQCGWSSHTRQQQGQQ